MLTKSYSFVGTASNKFDGTIPAEFSQLSSLKALELSENKLKGDIPELAGLIQLSLLRLGT
jgi:hypothetical protein